MALSIGIDATAPEASEPHPAAWQCARAMSRRLGILLPDGATLLLRREYRAFYRSLGMAREGFVVDKAYLASRSERRTRETVA